MHYINFKMIHWRKSPMYLKIFVFKESERERINKGGLGGTAGMWGGAEIQKDRIFFKSWGCKIQQEEHRLELRIRISRWKSANDEGYVIHDWNLYLWLSTHLIVNPSKLFLMLSTWNFFPLSAVSTTEANMHLASRTSKIALWPSPGTQICAFGLRGFSLAIFCQS